MSGCLYNAAMFKHFCIVCFANICRSPVAEYMLRQVVPTDVEIRSAGIQARTNYEAAADMQDIMKANGLDIAGHRSKLLDMDMVRWSELILVLEKGHQRFIEGKFPMARGRVQLLGKWTVGDIADPYGKAREDYEHCVVQLHEAVDAWVERLFPKSPKLAEAECYNGNTD